MPDENIQSIPAAARATRLSPEITDVIAAWVQENTMNRVDGEYPGSIYDLDLDGDDFSQVGVDGHVDLGELARLIQEAERERCAKVAEAGCETCPCGCGGELASKIRSGE